MGFFDIFKTSEKAVDTGLDLVKMGAKGIDALFYTDEEKAQNAGKIAELKLEYGKLNVEHVKATLGESSARSISRRYIAWGIIGLGVVLTLWSLVTYSWGHDDIATFAYNLLKTWMPMIGGVGAFYFGVHLVRGLKK